MNVMLALLCFHFSEPGSATSSNLSYYPSPKKKAAQHFRESSNQSGCTIEPDFDESEGIFLSQKGEEKQVFVKLKHIICLIQKENKCPDVSEDPVEW